MGEIIPPTELYQRAEITTGARLANWLGFGEGPRRLDTMDEHQLRDIGMSRTEVNRVRLILHYPY